MSLEQKFKSACDQVKTFSKKPPDSDMLEIYSLFKQATMGDVNITKPSDFKGKAKWDAWNGKKGWPEQKAKESYIEIVKNLRSKYE